MHEFYDIYKENLILVFNKTQTIHQKDLIVVRNKTEIVENENWITMEYSSDWESLLTFKVPSKMRMINQLISYQQSMKLIEEMSYGVLSFTYDTIPYSIGINYVVIDGELYFHTGMKGFKLNGLNVPVSFIIIKDFGINEQMATHNHQSVMMQGTMKLVEDTETKVKVMNTLLLDLAPTNGRIITEERVQSIAILKLEKQFLIGKSHIR